METAGTDGRDGTVYLVLDDFAMFGRAYRETDQGRADRQTIIANLLSSQYERPLKIVAFNTIQGWAADVTAELAGELQARTRDDERAPALREFLDRALPSPCRSATSGPLTSSSMAALATLGAGPNAHWVFGGGAHP